ncbi:MAG: (E)-4-hydroxy-3-methylbut-2-enyl-diphosphate synthase, partial [Candidatus Eisenbacteria bacterium]|nr:(E)-4-hydroxy-3-methylbut-2-enyl-diphosphate synthase [Candidatus Eisenbacteria bacterium]
MFRRPSREVRIGPLRIGADNPILIQSMTVADTLDTEAVAAEIEQLAAAGCPLVRVTVPHLPAADNLPAIREALRRRGVTVPLVADIHFKPAAALASIRWVEKVRINPGNYVDRKRFAVREYTDDDYAAELGRIREEFAPLVARLAETGTALRIGTNHGSLSDRIVNRYGDTPEGMVESALEFVRICESLDYRDIVLSMKSSVPSVMVAANRLLAARMAEEGMEYPIHLGVTEAGGGLEGRIKSAIGIGALLMEGIGDTIRVSLTEDSVHEIEACRRVLVAAEKHREPLHWAPAQRVSFPRRETRDGRIGALRFGGKTPCRVEGPVGADPETDPRGAAAEAVALLRPADPVSPRAVAELIRVQSPRSLSLGALEEFHEAPVSYTHLTL